MATFRLGANRKYIITNRSLSPTIRIDIGIWVATRATELEESNLCYTDAARTGRSIIDRVRRPDHLVDSAIGGIAGLASGALGVGGGFLMVPLQLVWKHTDQRCSSGTSLAAILPIALVGAAAYYFGRGEPQVNLSVALLLAPGGAAGAFVGARAARKIPERALMILVAILIMVVGLKEVHDSVLGISYQGLGSRGGGHDANQYLLITLSGLIIGTLSGLTGVGGGIFLVPTMVLGFGISQRVAQGTSLVAILPTAAVGALTHYWHGSVDTRSAAWIAMAGVPAALLGSALALWLPQRILAGLFGVFLLVAAILIWSRHERLPWSSAT